MSSGWVTTGSSSDAVAAGQELARGHEADPVRDDGGDLVPEGVVDDGQAGVGVLQEEPVVVRLVQRVDRNGHRPDADGAQEGGGEGSGVVEDEQDPFLPPQAEVGQAAGRRRRPGRTRPA